MDCLAGLFIHVIHCFTRAFSIDSSYRKKIIKAKDGAEAQYANYLSGSSV